MIVIIEKAIEAVIVIEVEIAQRADGMSKPRMGTPGGAKLRVLRERAGRTQLWVELEAELGTRRIAGRARDLARHPSAPS